MERKPYSAGAVKFSFWFMEFRKTVQLLSEGKSFADIKKLNEETNIYGAPTKLRAQQIYSTVTAPSRPVFGLNPFHLTPVSVFTMMPRSWS